MIDDELKEKLKDRDINDYWHAMKFLVNAGYDATAAHINAHHLFKPENYFTGLSKNQKFKEIEGDKHILSFEILKVSNDSIGDFISYFEKKSEPINDVRFQRDTIEMVIDTKEMFKFYCWKFNDETHGYIDLIRLPKIVDPADPLSGMFGNPIGDLERILEDDYNRNRLERDIREARRMYDNELGSFLRYLGDIGD